MTLTAYNKYVRIADFLFFGLIVIVCADVTARIIVANESLLYALSKTMYYLAIQPIGTILLLAPFGIIGSASSAKKGNSHLKWLIFTCCFIPVSAFYFLGHIDAQVALKQHKWTAASLSVGLMPIVSLPIIGIGFIIATVVSTLIEKLSRNVNGELR